MHTSAFDEILHRVAQVLAGGEEGDADAWTALDEDVRRALRHGGLPPAPTWFPDGTGRPGVERLAVALCGPDGRIREAALAYAGHTPALLPLVVIRCADWAGPVRERARTVLRAELSGPGSRPSETLGALAPVVLRVAGRRHGDAARELLVQVLREGPEAGVTVLRASRDRRVRRLAHRIAVDRGLLSPAQLAATAVADPDVVVQDLCADAVLAAVGADDGTAGGAPLTRLLGAVRPGRLAPLLDDSSPRVVRETRKALRPWADHFPVAGLPRPAAVAPSPRVEGDATTPPPEAGGAPRSGTAAPEAPRARGRMRRMLGFRGVFHRPR
ncbi:hypothetical protein [Streptomyces sp. NPDC055912]|uniref:hypothetical protein n=1 Tax=Streptomyces sp. NPDC055912 TaxID=3345660 RepID=UPI0035DAC1BD